MQFNDSSDMNAVRRSSRVRCEKKQFDYSNLIEPQRSTIKTKSKGKKKSNVSKSFDRARKQVPIKSSNSEVPLSSVLSKIVRQNQDSSDKKMTSPANDQKIENESAHNQPFKPPFKVYMRSNQGLQSRSSDDPKEISFRSKLETIEQRSTTKYKSAPIFTPTRSTSQFSSASRIPFMRYCKRCHVALTGIRHRCVECKDFYLCSECSIHDRSHDPNHQFFQINAPARDIENNQQSIVNSDINKTINVNKMTNTLNNSSIEKNDSTVNEIEQSKESDKKSPHKRRLLNDEESSSNVKILTSPISVESKLSNDQSTNVTKSPDESKKSLKKKKLINDDEKIKFGKSDEVSTNVSSFTDSIQMQLKVIAKNMIEYEQVKLDIMKLIIESMKRVSEN